MSNLYKTILALCESRGIKGGKLCTDLGISKGTLTDLKMGRQKSLSASNAQKIAAYFGVSVGYLLGEEDASPISHEMNEKSNLLAKITIKAQRDPQFLAAIEALYNMDDDRRNALMLLMQK